MFGVTVVTNIFEVTNYLGLGNRDEHFGNRDEHCHLLGMGDYCDKYL